MRTIAAALCLFHRQQRQEPPRRCSGFAPRHALAAVAFTVTKLSQFSEKSATEAGIGIECARSACHILVILRTMCINRIRRTLCALARAIGNTPAKGCALPAEGAASNRAMAILVQGKCGNGRRSCGFQVPSRSRSICRELPHSLDCAGDLLAHRRRCLIAVMPLARRAAPTATLFPCWVLRFRSRRHISSIDELRAFRSIFAGSHVVNVQRAPSLQR